MNEVINYHYDFQGFKIIQTINRSDSVFKQHYVRDPQGSVLAIYTDTSAINFKKLTLSELSIYGSSRLGTIQLDSVLYKQNGNNIVTPTISNVYTQKLGLKRYELSNHLGNVTTVVSDRKFIQGNGQNAYFVADVVSVTDYYAYGMKITERSWGKDARYQYNGKEQDKGFGRYNFDGRMYDERSCRWMSLDPQAGKYAGISPYVGFGNNPILFVDPDGGDNIVYIVLTESARAKLTIEDKQKIIANISNYLNEKHIGNETYIKNGVGVVIFEGNPLDFAKVMGKLSTTDTYINIGTDKEDITESAKQLGKIFVKDDDKSFTAKNPERANNSRPGVFISLKSIEDIENGVGNFGKLTPANEDNKHDWIKFLSLHGFIHNAGNEHSDGTPNGLLGGGKQILDKVVLNQDNTIAAESASLVGAMKNISTKGESAFEKKAVESNGGTGAARTLLNIYFNSKKPVDNLSKPK